MSFSTIVTYGTSTELTFNTIFVEVSGGLVRLKDLGGAVYSTSDPAVTMANQLMLTTLNTFSAVTSVSGSDSVQFQLTVNGTLYWWSSVASAWQASDGTLAQSSTAAQINTNGSTLISGLGLTTPAYLSVRAILHSATGSTRPSLTSVTIGYADVVPTTTAMNLNTVYVYLKDLLGATQYNSSQPAILYVKNDRVFYHGNNLILPFTKTATFNSLGYASIAVIETTTPNESLKFAISYYEGLSRKEMRFNPAVVPNSASTSLSGFATVQTADFG